MNLIEAHYVQFRSDCFKLHYRVSISCSAVVSIVFYCSGIHFIVFGSLTYAYFSVKESLCEDASDRFLTCERLQTRFLRD